METREKFNKKYLPGLSINKSQAYGICNSIRRTSDNIIKEGYRYRLTEPIPSVTSVINSNTPKIEDRTAFNFAEVGKTKGRPQHYTYYITRWDKIKKERSARGVRIHHYSSSYPELDTPIDGYEENVKKFYSNIISTTDYGKYHFIGTEILISDGELAGTIDLLLYDLTIMKFIIVEMKVDASMNKTSTNYFLNQFKTIPYSKYNYSGLQLSLYQKLLEKNGVPVSERWVVNIKEDGYEIIPMELLLV